ncbi:MAG: hypothetical protein LW636_09770 [Planctomycetaceae bacterium]|nr:hypothetical protein [Planctomycetaceae bacterium]
MSGSARERLLPAVCALGFASGLPNVLVTDTMSAWLSDLGFNTKDIGLLGILTLPYGLKLLWAPLLDRYAAPGFARLGLRRSWIAFFSTLLIVGFGVLAWLGPSAAASPVLPAAIAGFAIAVLSASLDAAVDAHRTDGASGGDEGPAASAFVLGYRIAFVSIGALVLMMHGQIADLLGGRDDPAARALAWRLAIAGGGGAMVVGIASALLSPEPPRRHAPETLFTAIIGPFGSFARSLGARLAVVLFVAFLFRLPDLLGNRMTMPFLRQELGYTLEEIGVIRQFIGFTMTIAGALAGGWCVKRWGLGPALAVFGILQIASNAGYLFLDVFGRGTPVFAGMAFGAPGSALPLFVPEPSIVGLASVVVVENLCNGLVSAAFVAYFMTLCEPRFAAAQYAVLSGLMYLAGSLVSSRSGYLVESLGYFWFFAFSIVVGLPPLLALPWAMPRARAENTRESAA